MFYHGSLGSAWQQLKLQGLQQETGIGMERWGGAV